MQLISVLIPIASLCFACETDRSVAAAKSASAHSTATEVVATVTKVERNFNGGMIMPTSVLIADAPNGTTVVLRNYMHKGCTSRPTFRVRTVENGTATIVESPGVLPAATCRADTNVTISLSARNIRDVRLLDADGNRVKTWRAPTS